MQSANFALLANLANSLPLETRTRLLEYLHTYGFDVDLRQIISAFQGPVCPSTTTTSVNYASPSPSPSPSVVRPTQSNTVPRADFTRMKVVELKQELRNRGLRTTGNKAELIVRLSEYERTHSSIPQEALAPSPLMTNPDNDVDGASTLFHSIPQQKPPPTLEMRPIEYSDASSRFASAPLRAVPFSTSSTFLVAPVIQTPKAENLPSTVTVPTVLLDTPTAAALHDDPVKCEPAGPTVAVLQREPLPKSPATSGTNYYDGAIMTVYGKRTAGPVRSVAAAKRRKCHNALDQNRAPFTPFQNHLQLDLVQDTSHDDDDDVICLDIESDEEIEEVKPIPVGCLISEAKIERKSVAKIDAETGTSAYPHVHMKHPSHDMKEEKKQHLSNKFTADVVLDLTEDEQQGIPATFATTTTTTTPSRGQSRSIFEDDDTHETGTLS